MTTKTLYNKTGRYICGASQPAETRQIQTWLSCTKHNKTFVPEEEKAKVERLILDEVKAQTAYPLFYPKSEAPWWQKITAMF